MAGTDLMLGNLFVIGMLISWTAGIRLRRAGAASWLTSCLTVAGTVLVFFACAASIQ